MQLYQPEAPLTATCTGTRRVDNVGTERRCSTMTSPRYNGGRVECSEHERRRQQREGAA